MAAVAKRQHSPSAELVSVGVPVFNAEKTIERALDGLLAQDYPKIEFLVSDNGSTDRTPEICAAYARKDARIKFVRSERNRGAAWNFNRVFELSTGPYFMWSAADDNRDPTFISQCVAALEAHPAAVLCHSRTETHVEGWNGVVCIGTLKTFVKPMDLFERYHETLVRFPATAIYGVYRSSALRKTSLFRATSGADTAFIKELALYGEFLEVPRVLFRYNNRRRWNSSNQDYRTFTGNSAKPPLYFPFVALFRDDWSRIGRAPLPARDKRRLRWILFNHEANRLTTRALVRVAGRVCPSHWKDALGKRLYSWWLDNPNVEVHDERAFFERMIKPRLTGWWRES